MEEMRRENVPGQGEVAGDTLRNNLILCKTKRSVSDSQPVATYCSNGCYLVLWWGLLHSHLCLHNPRIYRHVGRVNILPVPAHSLRADGGPLTELGDVLAR